MKKTLSIILLAFTGAAFTACSENKQADRKYEDFKEFVSERRDSVDRYFDREWAEMENEYNDKRMKAEEKMNEWPEETKAEFESLQNDWEQFRSEYEVEKNRRDMEQKTADMLKNVFPEGISNDMNNVTSSNLLAIHTHFVDYVSAHKDDLTREQWDRVEFLWEALGTKKNEVEKDLKTSDNLKIAEQKLRYGAIKAVNRPVAKAEENEAAKEEAK